MLSDTFSPESGWENANGLVGLGGHPEVAMDRDGNGHSAWMEEESYSHEYDIRANRFGPGDGWETSTGLERLTTDGWYPVVATDAGGHAWVVWTQSDGVANRIWVAQYSPPWLGGG